VTTIKEPTVSEAPAPSPAPGDVFRCIDYGLVLAAVKSRGPEGLAEALAARDVGAVLDALECDPPDLDRCAAALLLADPPRIAPLVLASRGRRAVKAARERRPKQLARALAGRDLAGFLAAARRQDVEAALAALGRQGGAAPGEPELKAALDGLASAGAGRFWSDLAARLVRPSIPPLPDGLAKRVAAALESIDRERLAGRLEDRLSCLWVELFRQAEERTYRAICRRLKTTGLCEFSPTSLLGAARRQLWQAIDSGAAVSWEVDRPGQLAQLAIRIAARDLAGRAKQLRRRREGPLPEDDAMIEDAPDFTDGVALGELIGRLPGCLEQELEQADEATRLTVELRVMQGKPWDEVVEAVGPTEPTLRTYLRNFLRRLGRRLEGGAS
jgi:hypothetical protein